MTFQNLKVFFESLWGIDYVASGTGNNASYFLNACSATSVVFAVLIAALCFRLILGVFKR